MGTGLVVSYGSLAVVLLGLLVGRHFDLCVFDEVLFTTRTSRYGKVMKAVGEYRKGKKLQGLANILVGVWQNRSLCAQTRSP